MTKKTLEMSAPELEAHEKYKASRRVANLTQEQREEKRAEARRRYAEMPPEAKEAYRVVRRERVRARTRNMSEEAREESKARQRKYYRENKRTFREKILLTSYGLTSEQYDRLLGEQRGLCKICLRAGSQFKADALLYVDHCHSTGRVRGLLCGFCNSGLGYFLDDPALLGRAISYLHGEEVL